MRVRPVLVSLCLCLSLTAMEAGGSGAASGTQINIPNINPGVERRLELLRQKEANERMQRENGQDTLQMVSLAAELKQYAAASDGSGCHRKPSGKPINWKNWLKDFAIG